MGTFMQDLRYSFRVLLKTPGFTIVAVLTIALGIGANTAIFSVINSVLLRPLPFQQPERLAGLWETEASPGSYPLTGPDFLDWQAQNKTFEGMSLYSWPRTFNASGSGEAEVISGIATEANFFRVLGVTPQIGRDFAAGEDVEGKNRIAILNYAFWQRRFGGKVDAVGKTVQLNSEAYTVVGVMPQWFNFPANADFWSPIDMTRKALGGEGSHSYRAIGRLKAGISMSQGRADLATIGQQLLKQYPDSHEGVTAVVNPLKEQITRSSESELWILLGAVALVLLVACTNVANLLLARATSRQREMAVRAAMGAGRSRLIRQLLTESILLSMIGAALGFLGAVWVVSYLRTADNIQIPRSSNPIEVDFTVLAFTIGVSVLVGILFGLAPSLQTSQVNLNDELKFSAQAVVSPSSKRRLIRDVLVVGEIAISLALLVGAGLLLRSFALMRTANVGVQTENVVTMGVNLPQTKYSTLAARRAFYDQMLGRFSHIPGMQYVAVSSELPLEGGNNGYVTIPGDNDPAHAHQLVEWGYITPDYFRVFGIPFLEGANFSAEDIQRTAEVNLKLDEMARSSNPSKTMPPDLTFVAIINHAMAQMFWPNQSPIGKIFNKNPAIRVIGVVGDVREFGIREKPIPQTYFPLTAILDSRGFMQIVAKTTVPPASAFGPIRGELRSVDEGLGLFQPRTMDQVISDNMQDTNIQTFLLSVFAALALILAAVGIYGVMAYLVTQRRHEIGIRMALGAQQTDVLRLVLTHGTRLTVLGVVIGIGVALGLTRLIQSLLYGVGARDVLTFVVVSAILATVALMACYLPARRASRVDPMIALRYE